MTHSLLLSFNPYFIFSCPRHFVFPFLHCSFGCYMYVFFQLPISVQFSSVQLVSHARVFVTPLTAARLASLSITNSQSLLKLIKPSNHLILCHPLLLLPSVFLSIRVFSNDSFLHIRWPKYWSFSISPSSEYSGLISFRMDWFDRLDIQGTLKSLLQYHSSKASVLLALSFLYGPALTSIHDCWKHYSFD